MQFQSSTWNLHKAKRLRFEKEIKKCGKNMAISAMNTAKISLFQDEEEKLVLCCFLLEIRELKW